MSLWALARYDFGLTDAEFWRLSWARFLALLDRLVDARRRADYRAGLITAAIHNLVPRKSGRLAKPEDFFDLPVPRARFRSPEEMLSVAEKMNAAMGGRDVRSRGA